MAQNTRDAAEQSNFDLQKKVKCLTGELEEAKRAADAAAQAKVNIILQDLCSVRSAAVTENL